MKANDYMWLAGRTECDQTRSRARILGRLYLGSTSTDSVRWVRLLHAIIGLGGEVGELLTNVEHQVYYGDDTDEINWIEELGDCLWYIAEACRALEVPMAKVMEANIQKLKRRYPKKYEDWNALEENRDRVAEAEAIEAAVACLSDEEIERVPSPPSVLPEEVKHRPEKPIYASAREPHPNCRYSTGYVSPSYSQFCRLCRKPVHKDNKIPFCPDCAEEMRSIFGDRNAANQKATQGD